MSRGDRHAADKPHGVAHRSGAGGARRGVNNLENAIRTRLGDVHIDQHPCSHASKPGEHGDERGDRQEVTNADRPAHGQPSAQCDRRHKRHVRQGGKGGLEDGAELAHAHVNAVLPGGFAPIAANLAWLLGEALHHLHTGHRAFNLLRNHRRLALRSQGRAVQFCTRGISHGEEKWDLHRDNPGDRRGDPQHHGEDQHQLQHAGSHQREHRDHSLHLRQVRDGARDHLAGAERPRCVLVDRLDRRKHPSAQAVLSAHAERARQETPQRLCNETRAGYRHQQPDRARAAIHGSTSEQRQ